MTATGYRLGDFSAFLPEVCRRLGADDLGLRGAVERALDPGADGRAHLAVMSEPYLSLLVEGRKTIESRFSRRRVAPFGEVRSGDVLLLKSQGGPVVAVAEAAHAESFRLDPSTWALVRGRYAKAICAQGDSFWEERSEARYATLIRIAGARQIAPLVVDKRDRRPWVVLDARSGIAVSRDQLELVAGVSASGRITGRAAYSAGETPASPNDQLALLL
jgi:hypothetical protein